MLKEEGIIEDIIQYLGILESYVHISNKQGLFNINRFGENFFGGLLDIIYDLNLRNTNHLKMNFPAIDLGDTYKKICYQVTSENDISKIRETLNKFERNKLYDQYDKINIIIIGRKKDYRKGSLKCYSKFSFSISENIIDIGGLMSEIGRLSRNKIEEVLDYFKNNFDKSVFYKISQLSTSKELLKDEEVNESYPFSYYSYGTGKVRVDAYLPVKISDEISCLFTFGQDDISGCMLTLDERILKERFFIDYKKDISERQFIAYIEENKVCIDFPNNRFITDMETANHIITIIDKLYDNYIKKKKEIHSLIGADYFLEGNKGKYKIIEMPKHIWKMLCDFSFKHDYFMGEGEWDIFNPQHGYSNIMVYKNHKDISFKADIIVKLYKEDLEQDNIQIIWESGYTNSLKDNEGFNNKQKWKVDYTHDWLIDKFIPYVLYLDYEKERTLFRKMLTYDEFKKQLKLEQFGIKSLRRYKK